MPKIFSVPSVTWETENRVPVRTPGMKNNEGRRDGSVAKSAGCSCQGSRFGCRHPHGGSQPSTTPAPGNLMLPPRHQACMRVAHRHICRQIAHRHKINANSVKEIMITVRKSGCFAPCCWKNKKTMLEIVGLFLRKLNVQSLCNLVAVQAYILGNKNA